MDKVTVQEKVHQIFAQYITRDFSDKDDFFKLGGHSIQATEVVLQVEKTFNILISDAEVKALRTVDDIATFVIKKIG